MGKAVIKITPACRQAALIASAIKSATVVAYEDLGPEAIRLLEVENFPATVVNDAHGGDAYIDGVKKYKK